MEITVPGAGTFSEKTRDNEAFYGVGGRYNFGNMGVFLEWNKHDGSPSTTTWPDYSCVSERLGPGPLS